MAVGLVFLLGLPLAVFAAPVLVVDDRGVVVTFDKPPQRVVSLRPSLTESVCALG